MMDWIANALGISAREAILLVCFAYIFTVVTVIWSIGLVQGNHSIMDAFYGWGYATVAWIAYACASPVSQTAALLLLMTSLHGTRLGYYLSRRWRGYRRTVGGDARYIHFTKQFAPGYWWKSFFVVLHPQSLLIMVLSLPVILGIASEAPNARPIGVVALIGFVVFGVGLYYEWLGDGQLQAFKADPHNKGRYLETGVWALTRHPNYFGNAAVWWGIWLVAVDGDSALWWTAVGPVINTVMLTSFLGAKFQDRWMGSRAGYSQLMARRNRFFPRLLGKP